MADMNVWSQRDTCSIVGVGNTEYSRNSGRSELTLASEAVEAALKDAGLTVADVDGLVRCDYDVVTPHALSMSLGIKNLTYFGDVGPGGTAPPGQVAHAVAAILSGQAKTVVVYRALNGRSGLRLGSGKQRIHSDVVGGRGTYDELFIPYGLIAAGQAFGMYAQRHMIDFGTTTDQLAEVALVCRENANDNPNAQSGGKNLTLDEYHNSRMIATPLRLFDYCQETDGACALVITSTERAKDLRQHPVLISSVAMGAPDDVRGGVIFPSVTRKDITYLSSFNCAKTLYNRAGFGPDEVDVAQVYDCFTISVLIQLEAYGFCKRGESGPFVESGAIRRTGSLPVNTAGGHLSEGYIHGMNMIAEGVRQMRRTANVQVADAETCLVTGGPALLTTALMLRRA